MSEFNPGDRVLVNGNLVATIQNYDADNNLVVLVSTPPGGGEDRLTAHISQTRLEHLVTPAIGSTERPVTDEAPAEVEGETEESE